MIGASKILTVSYGTFSCTLEGFDDPFNTMKAIAEYFRDLAAEDRYFGAEPPTPDAAMLHKIAEREIQRRVEAKINENGVILRADSSQPPLPAPDSAPVPVEKAAVAAPMVQAQVVQTPVPQALVVQAPVVQAALAEPVVQAPVAQASVAAPVALSPVAPIAESAVPAAAGHDPHAESIAAKLTRIRSAVAQSRPAITAPAAYAEDEDETATAAPVTLTPPLTEALPLTLPEQDQDEDDAVMEAELAGLMASLDAAPTAASAPEPEYEAQEIARDDSAAASGAFTGDLADDDAFDADLDDDDLSTMFVEFDPATESDVSPETETTAHDAAEALETDDLEALDFDMAEVAESDLDATDLEMLDLDTLDPDTADAEAMAPAISLAETPAMTVPKIDLSVLGFAPEPEPEAEPEAAHPDLAPEAAEAAPVSDRIQRARARVIRIRRPDSASVAPAEVTAETAPPAAAIAPNATLSPEAEADLLRELAEVQAEAKLIPEDATARPVRPVRPQRPVRNVAPPPAAPMIEAEAGEAAVSRLLAETNSQLAGPENRRRLAAIQQLKAAVAATVADRRAGAARPINDAERQTPYRDDLSRMVSPEADDLTVTPRPLPLVLVSEQRIDRAVGVTPVRPQRLSAVPSAVAPAAPEHAPAQMQATAEPLASDQDEDEEEEDLDEANIFTDSRGFAEFADRLGAQGLPALMEAAAAYTACVEGRPHFSRPQIMRQVAALESAAMNNREDGLRSFGTLLRNGKIVKVRRGQYALSEESHMMNEARKLVG